MREAEGAGTASDDGGSRDPALDELREAYESGQLVVLAGAGVSAAAGLPGWKRLVELLAERARARKANDEVLAEIADLSGRCEYVEALSAARDFLGAAEFGVVVERCLNDAKVEPPEIAKAIAALAPKLRAVLTTSVDHLLERAFAGKWPVLARATGDIARRKHFILKLHGTLLDRSTWVFTREEHDRAMYADENLKVAFTALFHACPILFVGYGLRDDDFSLLLGRVRAFAGPQPPRHFALVEAKDVTPRRRKSLEDAGVRLISYENPDKAHGAAVEILREIPAPTQSGVPASTSASRRFTRAEVMGLLEREGIHELSSLRNRRPWAVRVRDPDSETRIQAIPRLMALLGMDVVSASALDMLELGRSSAPYPYAIDTFVGIPSDGPFVVAFGPIAFIPTGASNFTALAARIAHHGGIVRAYGVAGANMPAVAGVSVVSSVEDTLRAIVREPLHAHATKCLETWTDEREHRFIQGRAHLPHGGDLPVADAIDKALEGNRCALLLGDFGTGKSTQMARRAARMARAYLADQQRYPAPALLPLTGMKPVLGDILAHHLGGLSVEAFSLAVDLGMVEPIFDGLDELAHDFVSPAQAMNTLLDAFDEQRIRSIITSRKVLFRTPEQMEEALRGIAGLMVVDLQGLDPAEVAEFVEKATASTEDAERTLESIKHIHDLENLAQRPALLELIIENRAKLSREEITASALYRMAAEDWLGSRQGQERDVSRTQRLAFARSLARTLFSSSAESVPYVDIARGVLDLLGSSFGSLDRPLLEVRLAVFLASDEASDQFRFAHRSFLEYFLAVDIADRLDADRPDALDLPRLTPEIVDFLAGIDGWGARRAKMQSMLVGPYRARVSENALLALYYTARAKVEEGEALGAVLDEEIPERAMLPGAQLSGVRLPWISLPGSDLTGADLSQADLRFADLRGARLDRAKADHALLDGSLLDEACAGDMDVFAASLVDVAVASVQWDRNSLMRATILEKAGTGDEPRGTTSPPAPVYCAQVAPSDVVWSPNGRWLAGGVGTSIQIHDAVTGALRAFLSGHRDFVCAVAFSPDGLTLASVSDDTTIRLWDVQSGTHRQTLSGHLDRVRSVAFSPDGLTLASASYDNNVLLWDAKSGTIHQTFSGHQDYVKSVAFSPDGLTLASASDDMTVRLWDIPSGTLRRTLRDHEGFVCSVAFSPDGRVLASSSVDNTVRLWNAHSGALRQVLSGHRSFVWAAVFSSDGRVIASASDDKTIRLWDAHFGTLRQTLSGHQANVTSVAFSPNGRALASTSDDNTVRLWDAQSGAIRQTLSSNPDYVRFVAFSPNGCALVAASSDNTVRLWDARSGALRLSLAGHQDHVNCVTFSPDGRTLASASADRTVRLWDALSNSLRQTPIGHQGAVWSVAFSPDGLSLASASDDHMIRLWDTQSGSLQQTLVGHRGFVWSVAFSPDGLSLASASDDRTVRLWDARSGAPRQTIVGHQGTVWSVAFSPDGLSLASASDDRTVRLWDARSGAPRQTIDGHGDIVRSVAFSPDGCTLASASEDHMIRLWNPLTGTLLCTLSGHQSIVRSVAYSPDGRVLATASSDQTIRLWDTTSGQCLAILHATHAGFITLAGNTPFFLSSGDLSQLLHFVSGERITPASLWAPLFDRPDLVEAAIAGNPPDLAAMGLDTYAACERALIAERERRGLVRRRIPGRPFSPRRPAKR